MPVLSTSTRAEEEYVLFFYVTAPGEDNSNQGKDDGVDEGDTEGMRVIVGAVRLSSDSRDLRFGCYERLRHHIQDRTKEVGWYVYLVFSVLDVVAMVQTDCVEIINLTLC